MYTNTNLEWTADNILRLPGDIRKSFKKIVEGICFVLAVGEHVIMDLIFREIWTLLDELRESYQQSDIVSFLAVYKTGWPTCIGNIQLSNHLHGGDRATLVGIHGFDMPMSSFSRTLEQKANSCGGKIIIPHGAVFGVDCSKGSKS